MILTDAILTVSKDVTGYPYTAEDIESSYDVLHLELSGFRTLYIQKIFIARPVHFARAISLILLRSGLSKWFTIYLFLSVNVTIPLYYIFKFKKKVKTKRDVTMEKNKQTRACIINMKGFGICMSVSSI